MKPHAAILLAAGRGTRMASAAEDKILLPLAGKPVICHSISAFARSGIVSRLVIVYRDRPQQRAILRALENEPIQRLTLDWVTGGPERQDSVFHALTALPLWIPLVFIHDCARPLIRPETLAELETLAQAQPAVCLAHRIADTLKETSPGGPDPRVHRLTTVDRSRLWAMETPQVFDRELITEAYRRLRLQNRRVTDDTAALESAGFPVLLHENPHPNPKLTTP
ncbi:MAG: 2-C-methyl-D-erythritol 4-phosphate cytidylyltransferase, partial [Puniceicoccaceae bacterium]